MKRYILNFLLGIVLTISLFSCDKNEETTVVSPLDGLVKIKEGYALGAKAKVELWGKKNFFMGYNELKVVLYDSLNITEKITEAKVDFSPLMTMGMGTTMMKHACPFENPTDTVAQVFGGAVLFQMPTSSSGSWKLGVNVLNKKYGKKGTAQFDITVDNPTSTVMSVFTSQSADSSKLVLTLLQPVSPKVGINDIEFTLHRKASMMSWPADGTYTIEITPDMPSMGHGSPNNVNPVLTGNGHYKGKVNFTMTGEWRISVAVKKSGVTISKNTAFYIVL